MKKLRQTLPLLSTFSALLVVGMLFFAFTGVDAALEVDSVVTTLAPKQNDEPTVMAEDETVELVPTGLETGIELPEYNSTYSTAGDTVELNGYFKNDVIVAGNTVTINGLVEGDVIVAAGNITINAPVQGDVRLAGGNITLRETIARNATMVGGRIIIEKDANIGRDVYLQAGDLTLEGNVAGKITGGAGNVVLDGTVGNDVYFKNVGNLRLRSNASIDGDLFYSSANEAIIDAPAYVSGEIVYSPPLVEPKEKKTKFTAWFWIRKITGLFGLLLLGVIILKLFERRSAVVMKYMLSNVLKSFGWGLIYIFTVPAVLTLLLVTLVGIPLSIFGLLLFGASLYLAKIYVGTAIGKLLLPQTKAFLKPMVLGVSIIYVITEAIGVLPFPWFFIGTALSGIGMIWAAGGIALHLRERFSKHPSNPNGKKSHGSSK